MSDAFDNLEKQLALQEWPNVYLFKFIVSNNKESLAKTTALFDDTADLTVRTSSGGKFNSVSAKVLMLDVESIINIYKKAQEIPGIVSL